MPRIVPRFLFELGPQALGEVLADPSDAIGIIVEECKRQGYDGMVRRNWSMGTMLFPFNISFSTYKTEGFSMCCGWLAT